MSLNKAPRCPHCRKVYLRKLANILRDRLANHEFPESWTYDRATGKSKHYTTEAMRKQCARSLAKVEKELAALIAQAA